MKVVLRIAVIIHGLRFRVNTKKNDLPFDKSNLGERANVTITAFDLKKIDKKLKRRIEYDN